MTVIGIIGAGHIGSQIARGAVKLGYDVVISNSRAPETLAPLIDELGSHARAATRDEAAEAGDVVVVTVPLAAIETIPVEPLAGKIVLDTNNYYWERDGHIAELDNNEITVNELLQRRLPTSRVVKAFNHIGFGDITTDGTPAGTPNRRALATAGDDIDALAFITKFYDEFGFDTVSAGTLSESWRVERDRPAYVVRQNAEELRANLAKTERGDNLEKDAHA